MDSSHERPNPEKTAQRAGKPMLSVIRPVFGPLDFNNRRGWQKIWSPASAA
jgi:hypothetical protein